MDLLRQQLDELMGKNRNGDHDVPDVKFTDPEVCKNYLCGLCAHDLYTNTKKDLGPCEKVHDEQLKEHYDKAKANGEAFDWEAGFERYLDRLVTDLDQDICRANERLRRTQGDDGTAGPESDRIVELCAKVQQKLEEAQAKGEEGLVEESKRLMDEAEEMKREHRRLEQQLRTVPGTSTQKLRVCEVCGAYLNLFDSDTRFVDHFSGKIHLGCEKVRKMQREVREQRIKMWEGRMKRVSQRSSRSPSGRVSRDRVDNDRDGRERERDSYRDRDRDRERDRDRDRERERDRDRDRDRDSYRERDRDSYRERDRDRDRDSHRDRDRERDRDGYRGHDYDRHQGSDQYSRREPPRSQERGHERDRKRDRDYGRW